jgi:hypothetical protein
MTKLQEAEQLLSELTRGEKSRILQWVVRSRRQLPGYRMRSRGLRRRPVRRQDRIPGLAAVPGGRLGMSELRRRSSSRFRRMKLHKS